MPKTFGKEDIDLLHILSRTICATRRSINLTVSWIKIVLVTLEGKIAVSHSKGKIFPLTAGILVIFSLLVSACGMLSPRKIVVSLVSGALLTTAAFFSERDHSPFSWIPDLIICITLVLSSFRVVAS